jgi:hypothetical protein
MTALLRTASVCLLGLVCAGCGGGDQKKAVYPVRGQVLYRGKPAAEALVIFTPRPLGEVGAWPQGYPRARVQEDGSFRLGSYAEDDGAPAGEYAVTVLWMKRPPRDEENEVDVLQGRYSNPEASPFRVQVKEAKEGNDAGTIDLR